MYPTPCDSMDWSPPGSPVHGVFPGQNTGVGCHFFLQGNLPHPGIEPGSLALQADASPSEPPGNPWRVWLCFRLSRPRAHGRSAPLGIIPFASSGTALKPEQRSFFKMTLHSTFYIFFFFKHIRQPWSHWEKMSRERWQDKSTDASIQFSRSVASDSLRPHEPQLARPPCPSPAPGLHSNSNSNSNSCPNSCYKEVIKPLHLSPEQRNSHGFIPLKSDTYATP